MQTISLIISNLPIFKTLYELSDDFWLNNVEACIQETRFLSLDWETMSKLMMREKYNEKIVFTAAVKWVEHDLEGRRQHLKELFTKVVRLPQLSTSFLAEVVMCHPLIESISSPSFLRVAIEAFQYQGLANPEVRYPTAIALRFQPRQSFQDSTIYCYIAQGVTQYRFTSINENLQVTDFLGANREGHTYVYWKGRLYLFGGEISHENQAVDLASIQEFDMQSQKWKIIDFVMQFPRYSSASIGNNAIIFEVLSYSL